MAAAVSGGTPYPAGPQPEPDFQWQPSVAAPMFERNAGPVVMTDGAHGNFHAVDYRFDPFARLLQADGYQLKMTVDPITTASLQGVDVFVIADPVLGGEEAKWALPTPSALRPEEIVALEAWVTYGGSLLLIADQMPFGGSSEALGNAFGIVFHNGYALPVPGASGELVFKQATGALAEHAITRGRSEAEQVLLVKSFGGQAFRAVVPVEALMKMPDDWSVILPQAAGIMNASTPRIPARGLMQGAVLRHGKGRVAVFGEAAMFTAQTVMSAGKARPFGLNDREAPYNAQFALNVMHWLSGKLD